MCRGGRTDLLLLQIVVRPVKSVSFSESGVVSLFSPISSDFMSCSLRQSERILQNVSSVSFNRLSISVTASLSISQKMLLFLQDVSVPLPDVVKVNELSSMTTYSVPRIAFSSISSEMNTEKN